MRSLVSALVAGVALAFLSACGTLGTAEWAPEVVGTWHWVDTGLGSPPKADEFKATFEPGGKAVFWNGSGFRVEGTYSLKGRGKYGDREVHARMKWPAAGAKTSFTGSSVFVLRDKQLVLMGDPVTRFAKE